MKRAKLSAAMAALAFSLPVWAVSPAAAAPASSHCWMDVSTGKSSCYSSFNQVVKAVSGGRVDVAPVAAAFSDAQRDSIGAAPAATYVLGIVYADDNYTDASYTFTASGDCDTNADVDWQVGVMPAGWNDRISSFKSYGLCATRIWEHQFTGSSYGFAVNATFVGAMNDQASSIQWN